MSVSNFVCSTPSEGSAWEATLHCDDNGLGKPLARCNNKELGRYGEELAAEYLMAHGYEILEMNWRSAFGEVDIVASEGGATVLVEVKTRVADAQNTEIAPELAVTYRKQSKYQKLALVYLSLHTRVGAVRFDVVGIVLTGENEARLRHYPRAYEWDE